MAKLEEKNAVIVAPLSNFSKTKAQPAIYWRSRAEEERLGFVVAKPAVEAKTDNNASDALPTDATSGAASAAPGATSSGTADATDATTQTKSDANDKSESKDAANGSATGEANSNNTLLDL